MAATCLGLNTIFVLRMRAVTRVTGLCRSTNYHLAIQPEPTQPLTDAKGCFRRIAT
jgi:hypothetical protein